MRRAPRRARAQVRIKEIDGRDGFDAARKLHRFEFRIKLEGDGRDAIHELVQKNSQLPASAVDQRDDFRNVRGVDRFQTR